MLIRRLMVGWCILCCLVCSAPAVAGNSGPKTVKRNTLSHARFIGEMPWVPEK